MYRPLPPDPTRPIWTRARALGLSEADTELLCAAYRASDHWPYQFADRLGHGPEGLVTSSCDEPGSLNEVGFVEAFARNPGAYRLILCWLLNRPLPEGPAWTS